MRRSNCILAALLAWSLACPARADAGNGPEQVAARFSKSVAAASDKAESRYIRSFPNVFQLRDAAKAFTDTFSDAEAVAFLKKAAVDAEASRAERLAAVLGLALLSEKHNTVPFLTSRIGDRRSPLGWNASAGISFLPTKEARRIAEGVVTGTELHYQTRIKYLFLLRAVGNQGTLETLAKLKSAGEAPRVLEVRDRTAWFIKRRLSLEKAEDRDRWQRLELVFFQMRDWGPGFRGGRAGLMWGAEQLHLIEPEIPVEFLKARLSLEPRSSRDHNISNEVPLAAALAALQKNAELLPLLDEWATTTDLGYVSDACTAAADQLRGRKKD